MRWKACLTMALLAWTSGCGLFESAGADARRSAGNISQYFPLTVGSTWVYAHLDAKGAARSDILHTVTAVGYHEGWAVLENECSHGSCQQRGQRACRVDLALNLDSARRIG